MCYHRPVLFPNRPIFTLSAVAALLVAALSCPSDAAAQRSFTRGQPVRAQASRGDVGHAQFQALPLERSAQNHLLIRVHINGKPALLGVDSGAPVSAIALGTVDKFSKENATAPTDKKSS